MRPQRGGLLGEAADQAGLAATGLTAQEHGRRGPLTRLLKSIGQCRQLTFPSYENGTNHPTHHVCQHVMTYVVVRGIYPSA
ncbi:hypothetical protein GCM10022226_11240 [Sphaerisporangium flaviroseum]|uniref:Uncharacterized protein n=1 Tax=Sphaerisporangium flaviroseum TaxID=509199 RepID=A0ABP7HG67_9ACTN